MARSPGDAPRNGGLNRAGSRVGRVRRSNVLAEEALKERTKLRSAAADAVWEEVLRCDDAWRRVGPVNSEIDEVERLPRKLSSLLT